MDKRKVEQVDEFSNKKIKLYNYDKSFLSVTQWKQIYDVNDKIDVYRNDVEFHNLEANEFKEYKWIQPQWCKPNEKDLLSIYKLLSSKVGSDSADVVVDYYLSSCVVDVFVGAYLDFKVIIGEGSSEWFIVCVREIRYNVLADEIEWKIQFMGARQEYKWVSSNSLFFAPLYTHTFPVCHVSLGFESMSEILQKPIAIDFLAPIDGEDMDTCTISKCKKWIHAYITHMAIFIDQNEELTQVQEGQMCSFQLNKSEFIFEINNTLKEDSKRYFIYSSQFRYLVAPYGTFVTE